MIYLIGGPPKCGKTTLAKKLSKKLNISCVASDTLEVVVMNYIWKHVPKKFDELYPHSTMKGKTNDVTYSRNTSEQIAKNYIKQAKASYEAIDMFSICEIKDENDHIIEGYHVTPELATRLIKKYGKENFRVLFLIKSNPEKFLQDVKRSSTPNDWILSKTKKKDTFHKIAEMIHHYGQYFEKNAKRYGFKSLNMDDEFNQKIKSGIELLCD